MKREKIVITADTKNFLSIMSEGNPGALQVLLKMMYENEKGRLEGALTILAMDDMNIRGSQIWTAYKDYCRQDFKLFLESISSCDEKMVDAVNIETARHFHYNKDYLREDDIPYKAITHGASFMEELPIMTDEEVEELYSKEKPVKEINYGGDGK